MTERIFDIVMTTLALLGALTFVVRFAYTTGGDWRRSRAGRHVMLFTMMLAWMLLLHVVYLVLGDYPWREVVVWLSFIAFTVLLWQRVGVLEAEQREGRASLIEDEDNERSTNDSRT